MTAVLENAAWADVAGGLEAVYREVTARRWGDGLPVIPPTEARVRRMLRYARHAPDTPIGVLPPGRGTATVGRVAINAVMAGCLPEHLPVVLAATRAACVDEFNLYGIQATTNPVAVGAFVNGPVRAALGINDGWNCMGQGTRANATIGRALRLVLQNVGGARPGELDRATHGQPAKYSFLFAELEEQAPWGPYHTARGVEAEAGAVTVFGTTSFINFLEPSADAADMLRAFGRSIAFPTNNDSINVGQPLLVLSPEHAGVLAAAGLTRADVQRMLWEASFLDVREFSAANLAYWVRRAWEPVRGPLTADTRLPVSAAPEDIHLVVAGGPSIHTVYLPSLGHSLPVTVPIDDGDDEWNDRVARGERWPA